LFGLLLPLKWLRDDVLVLLSLGSELSDFSFSGGDPVVLIMVNGFLARVHAIICYDSDRGSHRRADLNVTRTRYKDT
jgi:hypothetical protein